MQPNQAARRWRCCPIQIMILTAHATTSSAIAAVKAGAADYLLKPQSISEIQNAVEKAIRKRRAQMNRRRTISLIAEALQALQDENNDFLFTETPLPADRRDKKIAQPAFTGHGKTQSVKEVKGIIRPHITRLRKKIEADITRPTLIRTVRGRGYMFSMT